MSWVAVILSLTSYNQFVHNKNMLKFLSIFQSYFILVSALAFLAKWDTFGSSSDCNSTATVVIFRPFGANDGGREVGFVIVGVALVLYTWMTIKDYRSAASRECGIFLTRNSKNDIVEFL